MKGKSRLGSNPLEWIQNSSEEITPNKSVQSKHNLHSKQKNQKTSSSAGLKEGWTRATFIVRESVLEKAKDLAYWERKKIQEIIDEALSSGLRNKKVKPRPKRHSEAEG